MKIHLPSVLLGLCFVFTLSFQQVAQRIPLLTADQQAILDTLEVVFLDDGSGNPLKTLRVRDANLQVVNGMGGTSTVNGLGNLIVGYQEDGSGTKSRTGSHNIIGGNNNSWKHFGGAILGENNVIDVGSNYASILGGQNNSIGVFGDYATITGGSSNFANGSRSSISGGANGFVSGDNDWLAGSLFEDD